MPTDTSYPQEVVNGMWVLFEKDHPVKASPQARVFLDELCMRYWATHKRVLSYFVLLQAVLAHLATRPNIEYKRVGTICHDAADRLINKKAPAALRYAPYSPQSGNLPVFMLQSSIERVAKKDEVEWSDD